MKSLLKKSTGLALVLSMLLTVTACGGGTKPAGTTEPSPAVTQTSAQKTTAAPKETEKSPSPASETTAAEATAAPGVRRFVDSLGREIELPAELNKVAPSGPLAQVVLYTVFPDKLCGLAKAFKKSQLAYFPEKYHHLPEFGQFYGKNTNLNKEALLAAAPDVIIDIGEAKKSAKEDMDKLQAQLNIPTVFIEATLADMASAYRKLGELFGDTETTEKPAAYCEQAIKFADDVRSKLSDEQKVPVYWAMGDKGLNTNAEKSFQSEVLQLVGADNVAKVEAVSRGGGSEVSFEQLLSWSPKYILVDNEKLGETIKSDATWQDYLKSKNAVTLAVPHEPYGLLADPPSVNRILGIYWLGQMLYPELYQRDLKKDFSEFYELFYHVKLTDEQLTKLLG